MSTLVHMTLRGLIKAGAAVQIARYALRRRRLLLEWQRVRRRRRALGVLALGAGGGLACWFLSQRREATPAWVQKKQRKQARRDAARRERERTPARPPDVHVEAGAETGLATPLADRLK